MNVIMWLKFEHAYFKAEVQHFSHYAMGTLHTPISVENFIKLRGTLIRFPDFFRMGTFIDSTHMKL